MLSLRVYARLCTQSRAACICVFGSRVARHREAHHRCRIQRCTRHPSPKLIAVPTVSCPASKGGGGGGTFLVFERRDIRGSYHPPQGCFKLANFFHSTWIYGFRHWITALCDVYIYVWNIRKRNGGTCARSTIAIRDVEVHVKCNLERSNASYFYIYIYINLFFSFFVELGGFEKVDSTFRSARTHEVPL